MKQYDFQSLLLGFITRKIPMWLPEEAPEEMFLDIFQKQMAAHNKEIKDILIKNGRNNSTMDSIT